jgi:hypothetical protein
MKKFSQFRQARPDYQVGMVTTFTGVMILVLLTLMMFFAIRVGVFEQRVSSNEMRQKLAFHAAESGINHAKEILEANSALVASMEQLDSGAYGWLRNDEYGRWKSCAQWAINDSNVGSLANLENPGNSVPDDTKTHPCFGGYDPAMRQFLYYYDYTEPLVQTDELFDDETEQVAVDALLCVMDVVEDAGEEVPVKGCHVWNPSNYALAPSAPSAVFTDPVGTVGNYLFMVTLLARGEADCVVSGNDTECAAEALVGEQVSSFGAASGGNAPLVPLTTRSSFPPSGSAEVVPNPNAGGVGVPVSVWMNANSSCDGQAVANPSSGSWATCEMHEWYGTSALPEDEACPDTSNCSCTQNESISYTMSNDDVLGIDLIADEQFPCDLFEFYFGVPRSEYETVKAYSKIIDDCSVLGPGSFGIYWVTGSSCTINANTQVGSLEAPVMLISAAAVTRLNGGAEIFGTVFVTDVEVAGAELESLGTNTVYGSVIVDALLGSYQGTFQAVWNDATARKAPGQGGLGAVPGGWTDFHRDWK